MKNDNKIKTWAVILIMFAIFSMVVGFLFNSIAGLSAKVNGYQSKVENYQEALTIIHTKLGKLETDITWIKEFLQYPYYEE